MYGLPGNHYGINPDCAASLDGRVQAEAILALAYEQRTANLIALFNSPVSEGVDYAALRDQILTRLMGPKEPQA